MDYKTYENPVRTRRSTSSQEKQPSLLGKTIATQFVVFIALGILIFLIYKTHSSAFDRVKDLFSQVNRYDMTYSEIGDRVSAVFSSRLGENEPSAELTTAEKATEGASENTAQKDSAQENENTTSPEITATEVIGAGGEDLIYPKENASFSPFYLSKPIVMPVDSDRTTSPFGYRINPVTNKYGFHGGLDIAAKEGADIKAAFDGVVEKASKSAARGNYIFLKSGNITTVYCHCSELLVKEADAVKAGQVIAKVGHTGQATGPHLHFEIRINGIYYNPIWVLDFNGNKS